MSSDVGMTSALRNTLASLQDAKSGSASQNKSSAQTTNTNQGYQTPENIVDPQSLSARVNELQGVLDGLNQSTATLDLASQSSSKISSLLSEAEKFASNVLNDLKVQPAGGSESFSVLNQSISSVLTQIDEIVSDSAYKGKNLLQGDSLETAFTSGPVLVSQGSPLTTTALNVSPPPYTSAKGVETLLTNLATAQVTVNEALAGFNEDLATLQTRSDFAQESLSTLEADLSDLNLSSQSEEGANLLALQISQALSSGDFSLAGDNQKSLLNLF